jgi:hypothetical protein
LWAGPAEEQSPSKADTPILDLPVKLLPPIVLLIVVVVLLALLA